MALSLLPLYNYNKKGQAISIDLVISVALFLILLATMLTVWQNQNSAIEEQLILQDMKTTGSRAINFLVTSPGEAVDGSADWETENNIDNVKFIGLAKRDRVIDPAKIKKFAEYLNNPENSSEDYNKAKAKLLLPYDFQFRFLVGTNSIPGKTKGDIIEEKGTELKCETGCKELPENLYASIILNRIVNYEGADYSGEAIVEMQIFKEK